METLHSFQRTLGLVTVWNWGSSSYLRGCLALTLQALHGYSGVRLQAVYYPLQQSRDILSYPIHKVTTSWNWTLTFANKWRKRSCAKNQQYIHQWQWSEWREWQKVLLQTFCIPCSYFQMNVSSYLTEANWGVDQLWALYTFTCTWSDALMNATLMHLPLVGHLICSHFNLCLVN